MNTNTKQRCRLQDIKLARGHTFFSSSSLAGGLVIDGGAHRCEFANIMASTYDSRVVALEPNAALSIDHLHPNIELARAALSNGDSDGLLYLNENPEGSSIISDGSKHIEDEVTVLVKFRCLRSLVEEFEIDRIALLKLDIEGAEFEVIRSIDEDLAGRIHQITVEFHPADPKQGLEMARMESAFLHLAEHGFHMCRSSYHGYGDVLFLNSRYFEKPGRAVLMLLPYCRKAMELFLS